MSYMILALLVVGMIWLVTIEKFLNELIGVAYYALRKWKYKLIAEVASQEVYATSTQDQGVAKQP